MKALAARDDNEPGDLLRIYEQHGPLWMRMVGELAKKGMDVNPADGGDLVHDFYIEALPRVVERYNSSKGELRPYLNGAFRKFVLKRIVRSARSKGILVSLNEAMDEAPVAETSARERSPADLQERLARAITQLPLELRDMLVARLGGESDRLIAKRLGVSRYAVSQTLAEALGRAAIAMNLADAICADQRWIALRLWRDDAPLKEVAEELGITRRQAGKRYRQLLGTLAAAVAALEDVWSARRRWRHD